MSAKTFYEALGVAPTASFDEIKRAFRQQIARYHPDKVQHLGQEFQDMAAERAAELTEAYRILSSEEQRADYDRSIQTASPASIPAAPQAPPTAPPPGHGGDPPPPEPEVQRSGAYSQERARGDQFVRKAIVDRIRQALGTVAGQDDDAQVRGFDVAYVPKSKLFGRTKGPRVVARFVPRVDAAAVAEAWSLLGRWTTSPTDEICVLLLGTAVAGQQELAQAIAEQRRKNRGSKVVVIPIDARNWDAHMPVDAPRVCKDLLVRLKSNN